VGEPVLEELGDRDRPGLGGEPALVVLPEQPGQLLFGVLTIADRAPDLLALAGLGVLPQVDHDRP
jgi:hypothetical protein